MSNEKHW